MQYEKIAAAKFSPSWHGLLLLGLIVACSLLPASRQWPLLWLLPLTTYAALILLIPALRATVSLPRPGRFTPGTVVAAVVISLLTSIVLIGFHMNFHPDTSALVASLRFPALFSLVVGGILFSCLNALLEEIVFRGILFDAVRDWGPRLAVVATAILFGYGHRNGYPPGALGAILAGVYGAALGALRMVTGGIALPTLVHIGADATIYLILFAPQTFEPRTTGLWL